MSMVNLLAGEVFRRSDKFLCSQMVTSLNKGLNSDVICETFFDSTGFEHLCVNRHCFALADEAGERPDVIIAGSRMAGAETPGK